MMMLGFAGLGYAGFRRSAKVVGNANTVFGSTWEMAASSGRAFSFEGRQGAGKTTLPS